MSICLAIFSSPALLQTFRLFPSIPHAVDKHSVTEKLREPMLAKASVRGVFPGLSFIIFYPAENISAGFQSDHPVGR